MKSTTRFSKNKKGLECLNCGQPLRGTENFCSECGQVNDEVPLSITQFISEFFAGFFSFDSRFFNTLIPLLFKPGKVSKEYIQGKRMKYTNPFKMYLHTSIVFFLLTGLLSAISNYKDLNTEKITSEKMKDSIFSALKDEGIDLNMNNATVKYRLKLDSIFDVSDYKQQFTNDSISINVKDSLYKSLHQIGMKMKLLDIKIDTGELKNLEEIEDFDLTEYSKQADELIVSEELSKYFYDNSIMYKPSKPLVLGAVSVDLDNRTTDFGRFIDFSDSNKEMSPLEALDSLNVERTRFNLFKYQKAQEVNKLKKDTDFRKSYLKSSLSKASIAIFFLLPLLTLFFSLFYIRHSYSYSEHLVVVFNIQTVFFLLVTIATLFDAILKTDFLVNLILLLIFPFYIYKTLRNFYKQGRFKTLIKFFLLSFVSFLLALIGLVLIFFLAFVL